MASSLGFATAFARSLLAWHTDTAPRPVSASFAVTNRCNLRCAYCNTPFLDPSELGLEQIDTIFERLASVGVQRLGLMGGEPLFRRDIGEIVSLAKRRGFYVSVNTNLQLFKQRRDALDDVDLFFTSLDGEREAHEAARGPGSFDGVLDAIGELVRADRPVIAICVVAEHSLDQAEPLLALAERGGFKIHFQPQCTEAEIVRGGLSDAASNPRLRAFWSELLAHKRAGRPIASSSPYLEELAAWDDFRVSARLEPGTRCAASRGFLYVDPHGRAYPCAYTKGAADPVDMLGEDWQDALGRDTPCTRCSIGPYLEFNLLYQRPLRAGIHALRTYL